MTSVTFHIENLSPEIKKLVDIFYVNFPLFSLFLTYICSVIYMSTK
jgi:hypothetical protein